MEEKIIAKNTFYQILSRITTSGVGFIITILIAKQFGAAGFGDFTKITAYVGLFYLVVDFGLNAFYLQKDEDNKNFFTLLSFRIFFGIFLALLSIIISFFLPYSSIRFGIILFSFSIITQSIIQSASSLFQKHFRYDHLLLANIFGSLTSLILIIFAVKYSFSLPYFLVFLIVGAIASNIASLFLIRSALIKKDFNFPFIAALLKESLPFGLMLIFNLIYFRIDMILLSFFRPAEEIGIYGLSYRLFDFLIAVPLFLSNATYPHFLAWQKNHARLFTEIRKYIFVFLLFSLSTIILFWFLAPLLTFIKKDFEPSVLSFRILLFSLPLFFLTSFFQWILVVLRKQTFLLFVYILAALLNITLNIIFIPIFGYIACAIITGASEGLVLIFLAVKILSLQKNFEKEGKI